MTSFEEWFYDPVTPGSGSSLADWFNEEFEELSEEARIRIRETWMKFAYNAGMENNK